MAKNKTTLIVGLLACVALAVLLIKPKGLETPDQRAGQKLWPAPDLNKLVSIELADSGQALTLTKNDQATWLISGSEPFPASANKVFDFVEKVAQLQVIRVASHKEDEWPAFDLAASGDKAKTVNLKGSDSGFVLHLGKIREGGGQFVRVGDDATTYLVDTALTLDTSIANWEYKTLLKVAGDDIKEVRFSQADKDFGFARTTKDEEFKLTDLAATEQLKNTAQDSLKNIVGELGYAKRLPQTPEYREALAKASGVQVVSFAPHTYTIKVVKLTSAKPAAADAPKDKPAETTSKYYVHIETDDPSYAGLSELMTKWQFEVSEYLANNFRKTRSDFVAPQG